MEAANFYLLSGTWQRQPAPWLFLLQAILLRKQFLAILLRLRKSDWSTTSPVTHVRSRIQTARRERPSAQLCRCPGQQSVECPALGSNLAVRSRDLLKNQQEGEKKIEKTERSHVWRFELCSTSNISFNLVWYGHPSSFFHFILHKHSLASKSFLRG